MKQFDFFQEDNLRNWLDNVITSFIIQLSKLKQTLVEDFSERLRLIQANSTIYD